MKALKYFEKAWLAVAAVAFVIMGYNLIALRTVDSHVYFPLICGFFCLLLWYNIRGQRRFREKMENDKPDKQEKNQS